MAQHFEGMQVDEETVLGRFFECLDRAAQRASQADESDDMALDDDEEENLAKVGEQVAAKVTLVDENGSWILASVVSYNKQTDTYQVQDEDEATTKIFELPSSRIRRLYDEDCEANDLQKGDRVLAIFPETTSFYRAVISKTPKRNANGSVSEVVLKFEDDEDDAGRTPHRRVNIRYVLREHRPNSAGSRRPPSASGAGGGGSAGGSGNYGPPRAGDAPSGGDRMDTTGDGRSASASNWPAQHRADGPTATTYSDMIAAALEKLPRETGSFQQICDVIEDEFTDQLNWKLESDVRKTPVWKSSVRKILFSNARFSNTDSSDKHVFGFTHKLKVPNKPPSLAFLDTNNAVALEAAS